ncbi:DUF5615 family PIN-like protein [Cyanothece sp. BG0011]|uniref:DUF5615 family PIN-like protein n=1 Tax=Cyanothece sp. BG0011 TaxID=2082950 RepID=UPI000D1F3575|nr:DUF5615 family PIN-like protein [Cyanothece sp. BG0011]
MTIFAKVYLDENVDILVAELLLARGFEATTTRKQRMLGKSDEAQLAYTASFKYCLLTYNRVDFEKLHLAYISQKKTHSGIIICPEKSAYEVVERVVIILDTLTADEIANQLLYV